MSLSALIRRLKYGPAAAVLDGILRFTPFLDGKDAPPAAINFAGGGDFRAVGAAQLRLLQARAGLGAGDRVLDIGSGIGRLTVALAAAYPELDYRGFDIVRFGVRWAAKRVRGLPGYALAHVDVHNSFYNPRGRLAPDSFTFPYADGRFDLAFAISVFTHLLEGAAQNYLTQAARVLAPGGRLYLTAFLADAPLGATPALRLDHRLGAAHVAALDEPELATGYPLDWWRQRAEAAGMDLIEVFPGTWRGTGDGEDYQDALLLRRR